MRPLVLTLSAALLLPACGVNEDNYQEKFVEAACDLYYECIEDFAGYWDDVDACVNDIMENLDPVDEDYADCEFNSKNARKCLDSYKEITCEDIESGEAEFDEAACQNVWEC
jgi:hypothetical protein